MTLLKSPFCRVTAHPSVGDFHHSHTRQPIQEQATPFAGLHLRGDCCHSHWTAAHATGISFRLCGAARLFLWHFGGDGAHLLRRGRSGESHLLPTRTAASIAQGFSNFVARHSSFWTLGLRQLKPLTHIIFQADTVHVVVNGLLEPQT